MKFSDTDLQEFIAIYQEEFGEKLSLAEASERAFRLINLYAQLTKALPSEQNIPPSERSPEMKDVGMRL